MEYDYDKKEIKINRNLNELDSFVIDFISLLDEYVVVSGYVSILLGRSRATEDVDLLIPKIDAIKFKKLWDKIHKHEFECLNTSKTEEAFGILSEHAIRFARKGMPLPNMEFKFIKNELDKFSYVHKSKTLFFRIG